MQPHVRYHDSHPDSAAARAIVSLHGEAMRPSDVIIGASPSSFETAAPSSVADITIANRRSSRTVCWASSSANASSRIRLQVAFVEFIEYHDPERLQRRILLQQTSENAFRHHFNARGGTHFRIQPRAISDDRTHVATAVTATSSSPPPVQQYAVAPASISCAAAATTPSSNAIGTQVDLPAPGGACKTTLQCTANASSSEGKTSNDGQRGKLQFDRDRN